MPNDPQKRYLLVAIDRATCWVYLAVINDKTAKTAANFIKKLHQICPIKIKIILTDNGKEFTDRFNGRISQVVKTTYFANANEMITILNQYMKTYNNHLIQRNLDH